MIRGLVPLHVAAWLPPWGGRAHAAEAGGVPPGAEDALARAAGWITDGLEAAGIAAIVLGTVVTTFVFLRDGSRAGSSDGDAWVGAYERYRANLGRAILRSSLEVEIKGRWPVDGPTSSPRPPPVVVARRWEA